MADALIRCAVCAGPILPGDSIEVLADKQTYHSCCIPKPGRAPLTRDYLINLIKSWHKWRTDTTHQEAEKHAHLVLIESEMTVIGRDL